MRMAKSFFTQRHPWCCPSPGRVAWVSVYLLAAGLPLVQAQVLVVEPLLLQPSPLLQEQINPLVRREMPAFVSGQHIFGRTDLETVVGGDAMLRKGGHCAMLIDQKMNDGIPVPFFGRPAMTAPAIAQFARRLDCVLVPVQAERVKGAHFRITVHPPLELPRSDDRTADEQAMMVSINQFVEQWVRAHTEQWLWLHRRWAD